MGSRKKEKLLSAGRHSEKKWPSAARLAGFFRPMKQWTTHFAVMFGQGSMELVLPRGCAFCGGVLPPGQDFCGRCAPELTVSQAMMKYACLKCAMPLPAPPRVIIQPSEWGDADLKNRHVGFPDSPPSKIGLPDLPRADSGCGNCRGISHDFDAVIPLWIYRDAACDAVVAAKYAHNTPLAGAIGKRLGRQVLDRLGENRPDEVTFVPSHITRQISRGGSGTRSVALGVARTMGLPIVERVRVIRRIAKQAWLSDEKRKLNVSGAFVIRKSYAFPRPPKVADRHILVVDDVLTTGATASEIAKVLKQAGAREVTLAVIARAVRR